MKRKVFFIALSIAALFLFKGNDPLTICAQVQHGTLAKEAGIKAMEKAVKNYSGLSEFAASVLGKELQLEEVVELFERGYSGDRVYRVNGANGTVAILKVFSEKSANLFGELHSLTFLKNGPKIIALGRCGRDFILCETVAPGASLRHHFNTSSIETLEKASRACGRSLAKLHRSKPGQKIKLPIAFERKARDLLEKALPQLKHLNETALRKKLEQTIDSVPLFESGVIHADTKLMNVFYEPKSDLVTWIDPQKLAENLDAKDNPTGMPAKDLFAFLKDIERHDTEYYLDQDGAVKKRPFFSTDQLEQFKKAFQKGYVEAGGTLPSKEEYAFLELASSFYFIANENLDIPEPTRTRKRDYAQKLIMNLARGCEKN